MLRPDSFPLQQLGSSTACLCCLQGRAARRKSLPGQGNVPRDAHPFQGRVTRFESVPGQGNGPRDAKSVPEHTCSIPWPHHIILSSPSFSSLNLPSCCSWPSRLEQQLRKFREEKEGEERRPAKNEQSSPKMPRTPQKSIHHRLRVAIFKPSNRFPEPPPEEARGRMRLRGNAPPRYALRLEWQQPA